MPSWSASTSAPTRPPGTSIPDRSRNRRRHLLVGPGLEGSLHPASDASLRRPINVPLYPEPGRTPDVPLCAYFRAEEPVVRHRRSEPHVLRQFATEIQAEHGHGNRRSAWLSRRTGVGPLARMGRSVAAGPIPSVVPAAPIRLAVADLAIPVDGRREYGVAPPFVALGGSHASPDKAGRRGAPQRGRSCSSCRT